MSLNIYSFNFNLQLKTSWKISKVKRRIPIRHPQQQRQPWQHQIKMKGMSVLNLLKPMNKPPNCWRNCLQNRRCFKLLRQSLNNNNWNRCNNKIKRNNNPLQHHNMIAAVLLGEWLVLHSTTRWSISGTKRKGIFFGNFNNFEPFWALKITIFGKFFEK